MKVSNISPCMNCVSRQVGCHTECKDYNNWKLERDNQKEKISNEKKKYNAIIGYEVLKSERIKKRN